MKLSLLLILSLFLLAGCYVPSLNYTVVNEMGGGLGTNITLYDDNTVDVYVRLPHKNEEDVNSSITAYSKTDKSIYVKELNLWVIDDITQKDVDSKVSIHTDKKEYYVSDYPQIPDSSKYLKPNRGVTMMLVFNHTNLKKYNSLTLQCHALVNVDGKEIIVDKTIPVHRNDFWRLKMGY